MSQSIAINGIRLDEVRMLMGPSGNGSIVYLSYPMKEVRISQSNGKLSLLVPALLAVELYRSGILPQDVNTPVEVTIDNRSAGPFKVSEVRYPHNYQGPFEMVSFTLTHVPQAITQNARRSSRQSRSERAEGGTYVTDIAHYLDETGEMAQMPRPARKLASFLTLLIEAASGATLAGEHNSGIRCRTKACRGTIRTFLPTIRDEITWRCVVCEHHGVIRNWQNTKWNQLRSSGEPSLGE